jgi:hypothetical protein
MQLKNSINYTKHKQIVCIYAVFFGLSCGKLNVMRKINKPCQQDLQNI